MSHARATIRDAVKALLQGGNTAAGSRIYVHPSDPRTMFPAVTVMDVAEPQTTPTMPGGPMRLVERQMLLDITAELQQTGDYATARDDLMAQIEMLMAQPIPGVRSITHEGYQPDTQPGEMTLAVGRQRYALTYITTAADPSTAI